MPVRKKADSISTFHLPTDHTWKHPQTTKAPQQTWSAGAPFGLYQEYDDFRLTAHHLPGGHHVVGWGNAVFLTIGLSFALLHESPLAVLRDKSLACEFFGGFVFPEKSALSQQFTFLSHDDLLLMLVGVLSIFV